MNEVCKYLIFFIEMKFHIHIIFSKLLFLRSHMALETILPFLIEMLERWFWNSLQLVRYVSFNILQCTKWRLLRCFFFNLGKKKITYTQIEWIGKLRSHRDVFSGERFIDTSWCYKEAKPRWLQMIISHLALKYKFFVNYCLAIKKLNQYTFDELSLPSFMNMGSVFNCSQNVKAHSWSNWTVHRAFGL